MSDFKNRKRYIKKRNLLLNRLVKESGKSIDIPALKKISSTKRKRFNPNRLILISEMCDKEFPRELIEVPPVFCLIDSPHVAMKFLHDVEEILFVKKARHIFISHAMTVKIGLAASILFDEKILRAKRLWAEKGGRLIVFGQMSSRLSVNNFLAAFGALKTLRINLNQVRDSIDGNMGSHIYSFATSGNRNIVAAKSGACKELMDYFDLCLSYIGRKLTRDGRIKLTNAFTEVLGNAEEHAGEGGDWRLVGFFDARNRVCNFVITNEGPTIYETLVKSENTLLEDIATIEEVIKSQRSLREKIVSGVSDDELTEPIWNLMALQEGISSKRKLDPSRGKGMSDVLQFISEVKAMSDVANVVIISGKSYINVDYTYPIRPISVANGSKMEQWRRLSFNKENDLKALQDLDKVQYIKDKYQGTIIAGRFVVADDFMNRPRQ